jgi:virginiamycin A acetyltransferase
VEAASSRGGVWEKRRPPLKAIVATGAVVTRDVPPYAIVGGNPAAVLRSRFDSATVQRLRAIAWWDWDSEKVARNVRLICAGGVEALKRAA